MPTLTDAQDALAQAQAHENEARIAHNGARGHADSLRQQLATGDGDNVIPEDLTAADAKVEHTRLVLQGATAALSDLSAAVQRARAEEVCDEVVTVLPILGSALLDALDAVSAALVPVVPAAEAYDAFVSESVHKLEITARAIAEPAVTAPAASAPRRGSTVESPYSPDAKAPEPERPKAEPFRRLDFRYMGQPSVDRIPVTPCRGAAQLAAVVLPAMQALGASSQLLDHLKELAQGAPTIPTN